MSISGVYKKRLAELFSHPLSGITKLADMENKSAAELADQANKTVGGHFDGRPWAATDFNFKTDPDLRKIYANVALTLGSEPIHDPLRRAFQLTGLDPENPIHWRILLELVCNALFAFSRKVGRPRRSDHSDLYREVANLKNRNPSIKMNSALQIISKKATFKKTNGQSLNRNTLAKMYRSAERQRMRQLRKQTFDILFRNRPCNWSNEEIEAFLKGE
jgi:hypothetical protein